jgi:hypothetical protein
MTKKERKMSFKSIIAIYICLVFVSFKSNAELIDYTLVYNTGGFTSSSPLTFRTNRVSYGDPQGFTISYDISFQNSFSTDTAIFLELTNLITGEEFAYYQTADLVELGSNSYSGSISVGGLTQNILFNANVYSAYSNSNNVPTISNLAATFDGYYIGDLGNEVNLSGLQQHSMNIGIVPVPATFWLFGSGLISLVGFARCKTA